MPAILWASIYINKHYVTFTIDFFRRFALSILEILIKFAFFYIIGGFTVWTWRKAFWIKSTIIYVSNIITITITMRIYFGASSSIRVYNILLNRQFISTDDICKFLLGVFRKLMQFFSYEIYKRAIFIGKKSIIN